MMEPRQTQIGINQTLRLDWLERVARHMILGGEPEEIRERLGVYLLDRLPDGTRQERGQRSVEQTVSNLLRIWVNVPDGLEALRDDGLVLLQRLPTNDHLAIHWGMTLAVYPFVGRVAETLGRLLALQGEVTLEQVHLRMAEQLGRRSSVTRATQRVVRMFVEWNALQETSEKSLFIATDTRTVEDESLSVWLLETLLRSENAEMRDRQALLEHAALFPFDLKAASAQTWRLYPRLELYYQGLDQVLVVQR